MSYTLKGRIESRLAAALPVLLLAFALHRWWAIELVALMLAIGLALDLVYDRALEYQPGWLALPLGALELGLVYAAMRALELMAPLRWALLLYAVGWLAGQVFAHALFPRLRLEYAEAGGELGRRGALTAVAVAALAASGVGAAYSVRPPTVHLHGTVQGPLVIRHAQTLVGGVVNGGIVIRADHVTLRDVTVHRRRERHRHRGRAPRDARRTCTSSARELDGIHVRRARVMIEDCTVSSPARPVGAGHRHLVLDGQGDVDGRALHDRRRARGHRHAHVDGRRGAQPHRRDVAPRDHDGRDVDGCDPPQRRARRARASGSSASTTRSARSSTTRSSGTKPDAVATRSATASRSRRTSSRRRSWTTTRSSRARAASRRSTTRRSPDDDAAALPARRAHRPSRLPRPAVGASRSRSGSRRASST